MSRLPAAVRSFVDALERAGATVALDVPAAADGEWWMDVRHGDRSSNASWRRDRGFGVFLTEEDAYGAKPDEFHVDPEAAAGRLIQVLEAGVPDRAAVFPA